MRKLDIHISSYRIFGVLAQSEKEYFEKLNNEITKVEKSSELISMEDRNSRTGKKANDYVMEKYEDEVKNIAIFINTLRRKKIKESYISSRLLF